MADTCIDPDTGLAYRESEYRVTDPSAQLVLRIDKANRALAALQQAHGVQSSLFITAWNPCSRPTTPGENDNRQKMLLDDLQQLGEACFDGVGQHPTNGWPGEASILALGAGLEEAKVLGRRYEQNAVVWCGVDA